MPLKLKTQRVLKLKLSSVIDYNGLIYDSYINSPLLPIRNKNY